MKAHYVVILGLLAYTVTSWGSDTSRDRRVREAYSRWQVNGTASPEEKALMEEMLFSGSGQPRDNSLDQFGGPDAFGYRWVDNQAPDTAVFEWIELCGDPQAQFGPTGDDYAGPIAWSFPFPFYGVAYTSAYVSTNGKIAFLTADAAWQNQCASIDAVQPVISVHWDDMVAQQTEDCGSGTPRIKLRDFGDFLVIEWKDVWHYPNFYPSQRASFEAILFADGRIKLQYDSLNFGDYANSCTVGIDVPGSDGLEYVCNGVPASNQLELNRAVWFHPSSSAPAAPQALTAQASGDDLILQWFSVPAPSYNVYRDSTSDIAPIPENLLATTADTTYVDAGVIGSLPSYFYTVTAIVP